MLTLHNQKLLKQAMLNQPVFAESVDGNISAKADLSGVQNEVQQESPLDLQTICADFLCISAKKELKHNALALFVGTPEGTRTPSNWNRNPVPYPLDHGRIW